MYKITSETIFLAILVVCHIKACSCIEGGKNYTGPKRYIAYLTNANVTVMYEDWLCGGAIVSELFILTSAACAKDATYMYAIAGYDKYVQTKDLTNDTCTNAAKKKVVYTCAPKLYQFSYERIDLWANIDIALVKVESPFDFTKTVPGCTWTPSKIKVNYKSRYQETGTPALLFGWGHRFRWRAEGDATFLNERLLQYTHTRVINKTICKAAYDNATLQAIIEKYMFCTDGPGMFDDQGIELDDDPEGDNQNNEGCQDVNPALRTACLEREAMLRSQRREIVWESRRNGICQNDHGGPVVTFAGTQELLIGVASVFLINKDRKCTGPFLHTSTYCNSAFISCILNTTAKFLSSTRRVERGEFLCPSIGAPELSGIKLESRRISWIHHPDGPAANELDEDLIERPQISIQSFL